MKMGITCTHFTASTTFGNRAAGEKWCKESFAELWLALSGAQIKVCWRADHQQKKPNQAEREDISASSFFGHHSPKEFSINTHIVC